MSHKSFLLLLTGILIVPLVFGQNVDSAKVKTINHPSLFRDSVLNYEVNIPRWLYVKARNSASVFGGTLPAVKGIENAILISGYPKSAFKTFDDFKTFYLTGNTFGKPTNFDKEHIWYGQKDAINIDHGVKQRVFIFWKNRIYFDMFMLLETKSAYLWIQFVSTPETYDINISRFDEFMAGFKMTK